MEEADRQCERIAIMDLGKIVALGTAWTQPPITCSSL